MLQDAFGRIHTYLRISLTEKCNLRCFYCMPADYNTFTPPAQLMQLKEIESIARTFVHLGITKIRLTGGEPLVRKDAGDIISMLSAMPVELTISTNGIRLHEFLPQLQMANIKSVNISLDTLQEDKFLFITKQNKFKDVLQNIILMTQHNIHVKINVVVMSSVNDHEINDFIEWTKHLLVHVRFIEFMPFSGNSWDNKKVIGWQQILQTIESKYSFIKLKDDLHDTAKKYMVPGHAGTFAVISTITAPFCSSCNRLRLTADGKMKNCLFSTSETDLLSALRNGENLIPLIQQSVLSKAAERGGQFNENIELIDAAGMQNRTMIAIGG